MVGSMYEQDSMEFPDVSDMELHQIGRRDVSGCQNEMCHFCEVISDHVDRIETTRFREFKIGRAHV